MGFLRWSLPIFLFVVLSPAFAQQTSRGLDELRIWLKRVEVQGDTVEILGQSLKMHDVGKFLDVLEESQIIRGVPFVEIRDVQEGKKGLYAFRIRFAVNPRALT